jgi:hypothetical protein
MGNMQIMNAPTRSQADTLFMVVEHLGRPAPGTRPGCFIKHGTYFIDYGDPSCSAIFYINCRRS